MAELTHIIKESEGYAGPFLIGGIVVAGIKYLSKHSTPAVSTVLAAAPIGYFSTLMLSEPQVRAYMGPYTYNGLILVAASFFYYLLLKHTNLNFRVAFVVGFVAWAITVSLVAYLTS